MKYIEEYIPKLHIHQHSLLTRKVFFRHNFQHWSSSLYHQIMFVFKSSSSSSHLHLQFIQIWIISRSGSSYKGITGSRSSLDLDQHHWTGSGSSLDLDHLSGLDLDHHLIWIITAGSGSSLDLDLSESSYLDLDHLSIWISTGHHHVCTISSQEVLQSQPFFMLDVGPPPAGIHHHWPYWRILRTYYVHHKTSKEHPRTDYGNTGQPIGSPRALNYM